MGKIPDYITGCLQELHHVRWPTRQQAVRLALIVVAFVAIATVFFGFVDFLLGEVIRLLLSLT